ncbi:Hypothetical predicted protein [Xyrichtys novacula]|uniref:Uncharacterized protein n=1 Tax=Xyrichtys novacula TaxID=13765 RepID=A0AAV1H742_XYRNO|nr:Hypothetical predicted protein [Xyrichtys novacula]
MESAVLLSTMKNAYERNPCHFLNPRHECPQVSAATAPPGRTESSPFLQKTGELARKLIKINDSFRKHSGTKQRVKTAAQRLSFSVNLSGQEGARTRDPELSNPRPTVAALYFVFVRKHLSDKVREGGMRWRRK